MNDYVKLSSLMERVIHKYNQWESKKRTYGTSVPLSRAEIHTIAAVGDHPNINITTLAAVLGITKGAASQIAVYKRQVHNTAPQSSLRPFCRADAAR